MQSYELSECSYSGDSYSGCLVGKPKPGTGELMMKEPAQQALGDEHLGLLTVGWREKLRGVVKGQDKHRECCFM